MTLQGDHEGVDIRRCGRVRVKRFRSEGKGLVYREGRLVTRTNEDTVGTEGVTIVYVDRTLPNKIKD